MLIFKHRILVNEDQKRLFVNEGHPLLLKSWVLHKQHSQIAEQSIGLPKLQATLLSNRDVKTSLEAIDFLASDERLSSDPKLLPNIDKGDELVSDAIKSVPSRVTVACVPRSRRERNRPQCRGW